MLSLFAETLLPLAKALVKLNELSFLLSQAFLFPLPQLLDLVLGEEDPLAVNSLCFPTGFGEDRLSPLAHGAPARAGQQEP
jgi:hypothetical protein